MADKTEYSRLLIKRTNQSGIFPTIPGNPSFGLTQFTPTDTFIGEFFLNTQDDSLWIRTQNGQIPILVSGSTFTGGTGSCISDLYITNLHGCSPITLHDDFETITDKLYRNQSGGQYDNTLSFGTSLFQDIIELKAKDTVTLNESEFLLRSADPFGHSIVGGLVTGNNGIMDMILTSDPNLNSFMTKNDLQTNFVSSYDVAGFQQTISTSDANQSAKFFIDDMTSSPAIGVRFDDFNTTRFTQERYDDKSAILTIEQPTDWILTDTKQYDSVGNNIQHTIKTESLAYGHFAQIQVDSKTNSPGSNINMTASDGAISMNSASFTQIVSNGSVSMIGDNLSLQPKVEVNQFGVLINPQVGLFLTLQNIPAFADDADASLNGLTIGMIYQTNGAGAAPLNSPGIMMIKQ